jgi:uncharacterized protein (TIGR03086 family)
VDRSIALDQATASFAAILARVDSGDWTAPTPDPGWSVRDLVNHVIGGNRRYVLLLEGAPTVEVEALRRLDHLGTDPLASFIETSSLVAAAFREPGALGQVVHHRLGDRTGADLLVMRVIEHAVHGWDLAQAIGADPAIPPDVTAALLDAFAAEPALLPSLPYAPARLPDDADPQQRLLALTGRTG